MFRRLLLSRTVVVGTGLLWAGCVLLGARILLNYENTPGAPANALSRWPKNSHIARPSAKFIFVMLAHPNCPCTRASLAELEIVMAKLHGKLVAFVVFSRPEARAADVQSSDLWR